MEQGQSQLLKCRRIPPCGFFNLGGRYRLIPTDGETILVIDEKKKHKTFSSIKGTPYYIGTFFQPTEM